MASQAMKKLSALLVLADRGKTPVARTYSTNLNNILCSSAKAVGVPIAENPPVLILYPVVSKDRHTN